MQDQPAISLLDILHVVPLPVLEENIWKLLGQRGRCSYSLTCQSMCRQARKGLARKVTVKLTPQSLEDLRRSGSSFQNRYPAAKHLVLRGISLEEERLLYPSGERESSTWWLDYCNAWVAYFSQGVGTVTNLTLRHLSHHFFNPSIFLALASVFRSITHLDMESADPYDSHDDPDISFAPLRALKALRMYSSDSFTSVGVVAPDTVLALPKLESLEHWRGFDAPRFGTVLASAVHLTRFVSGPELPGNHIPAALTKLAELTICVLTAPGLNMPATFRSFLPTSSLQNLATLRLPDVSLDHSHLPALLELCALTHLSAAALQPLPPHLGLPHLRSLELTQEAHLNGNDFRTMVQLLPTLQLTSFKAKIRSEGAGCDANRLAGLSAALHQISHINLTLLSRRTQDWLRTIHSLAGLPGLHVLSLVNVPKYDSLAMNMTDPGSSLDDAVIRILSQQLRNLQVLKVRLRYTQVTGEGLAHLRHMTGLQRLELCDERPLCSPMRLQLADVIALDAALGAVAASRERMGQHYLHTMQLVTNLSRDLVDDLRRQLRAVQMIDRVDLESVDLFCSALHDHGMVDPDGRAAESAVGV